MNSEWPGSDSMHEGGAFYLMSDGAVVFLSENIEYKPESQLNPPHSSGGGVWGGLNTRCGKEPIQSQQF